MYWTLLSLLMPGFCCALCPRVNLPCLCSSTFYEPVSILCEHAQSLGEALGAIRSAMGVHIDSLAIVNTPIHRLGPFSFQQYKVGHLTLRKNQLTEIDAQAFDGPLEQSLTELGIKQNEMGAVPKEALDKLQNVRKLVLQQNNIDELQSDTFAEFKSQDKLTKLDMGGNLLKWFPELPSPFAPLTNLQELSLESNHLEQIPTAALEGQRESLSDLNLGANRIRNVPVGSLDFPNLTSLSLEFNEFTKIDSEVFRETQQLRYLYLTGNQFAHWDSKMFTYLQKLEILSIGRNKIRMIPKDAFRHTPSLTRLEMSNSAVEEVEYGAFRSIPKVKAIIMNRNQLYRVKMDTFRNLTELMTLDLQGNKIHTVDNGAWSDLPNLRHMDISSNDLRSLESATFQNSFHSSLRSRILYLCDNLWHCDHRLEWLRTWLQANPGIQVDKPDCRTICAGPDWLPPGWPIKNSIPIEFSTTPTTTKSTSTTSTTGRRRQTTLAIVSTTRHTTTTEPLTEVYERPLALFMEWMIRGPPHPNELFKLWPEVDNKLAAEENTQP